MKPHNLIACFAILLLLAENGFAQSPEVVWAHATGSIEGLETLSDIDVDLQTGDIIGTGYFNGDVDFDPGIGELILTPIGISDLFIVKYDQHGNLLWVNQFGGAHDEVGRKIKFDPSGNGDFYVTGFYTGYMDINPDPDKFDALVSTNSKDVFVAKFSSTGALIWARSFGSSGAEHVNAMELATDEKGGVVLGGMFSFYCDFDETANFEAVSNGYYDAFVIRYDKNGKVLWLSTMGGEDPDHVFNLAVDPHSNDVYITGYYIKIADFDPGPDTLLLEAPDYREFYLLKLDHQGALSWVKTMDAWITIPWINPADTNHVMLVGCYEQSYDLDPDPLLISPMSSYHQHIYLMQLDKNGNRQWLKTYDGDGDANPMDIALDPTGSGDVLISLNFDSTITIQGAPNTFLSAGSSDILVIGLDQQGEYQSGLHYGNTGPESVWALAIDIVKQVYLGGSFFSPTLTLGDIQLQNTDAAIDCDFFVAKLVPGTVGVNNVSTNIPCIVYPNPASTFATIEWESNGHPWFINLINPLGQIVYTNQGQGNLHVVESTRIPTTWMPPGQYSIQISQGNQHSTYSVIIQ